MNSRQRANILGCYVDLVTMAEAVDRLEALINRGDPAQIITLNAEIAYLARNDQSLKEIINSAPLVTADGIGTVWAGRKLGYPLPERVTGIDLVYALCARAATRGWKLYLLGAAPGVASAAAEKITGSYPGLKIAGVHHGYFQEKDVPALIEEIKTSAPQILLAALGAPKQEYFINKYCKQIGVPVSMGVGGSFDVIAGNKKRAPELVIKLNLEWLYRLLSEPTRIKRQLVLPRFALAVMDQKQHSRDKGIGK